jgi:MFS family permease
VLLSPPPEAAPGRWAATVGLALDQVVAWGVLYYAYTVLSAPLALELAVSRQFVAGAFSLCLLVSGLLARPVGRLLDRHGTRWLMVTGAAVGSLAMVALGSLQGPLSLLAVFAILGVAQALSLYEAAFRAVVDWFPEERLRSRASLLLTSIAGFSSTLFIPLTTHLVERHGWRSGVWLLAGALALTLPLRLLLPLSVRDARLQESAAPGSPRASASSSWLALGFAGHAFASTGVSIYLMWHLVERGQALESAAFVAGLAGAAQVPGRLLLLPLQRRLATANRLPLLFAVQAVALVGIAFAPVQVATGCVLLLGAASGMMTLERAAVLVEWYGRDTFGMQNGRIAAASVVAKAAAPFVVEALHGLASYAQVFLVLVVVYLVGAALALMAVHARKLEVGATVTADAAPGA